MKDKDIHKVIEILKKEYKKWDEAIVTQYANISRNPFKILISTMLSLRTKDNVTQKATDRLFEKADTPEKMRKLKVDDIEKLIYPVGFYKTKAKNIINACDFIISEFDGIVPDEIDDLLKIKGVGRKTANLVITLGYNKDGICVDTHVHRISNRLGYVKTKNPEQTEFALRKKLPIEYWREYNDLLVVYGQNLCKPISPFCTKCKLFEYCEKIGVKKYR
jgi:endonuclease-3